MGLQGRAAPVRMLGPRGAQRHFGALTALGMERPKFAVEIFELRAGDVMSRGEYDLVVGEATHKGDCLAYAVAEHDRLGRFDPERAVTLGIPEGPLWGRIHRGEAITLADGRIVAPEELVGTPRPGRRLVYSGDTAPSPGMVELARDADLLIHEATFGEEERGGPRDPGHSPARDAAIAARDAGVKRLVLTHISARYTRDAPELLAEARAVFSNTDIGKDGMVVEVPYREA